MRLVPPSLLPGLVSLALSALTIPVFGADQKAAGEAESAEPTETDLQRLYGERIDSINQGSVRFLGADAAQKVMVKLEGLKKSECRTDARGAFLCRVLVDSAVGAGPMETRRRTLTLVKDGDNWRLH
jgi:hypothetical protein